MKSTLEEIRKLVGLPCPHCGELLGVTRNVTAAGVCEERIWPDGEHEVLTDSGLYFKRERHWHCVNCGKLLPRTMLDAATNKEANSTSRKDIIEQINDAVVATRKSTLRFDATDKETK